MPTPTPTILSAPHLFAVASGVACAGPHACFFCGAACGEDHPTARFVKDSFNGRAGVAAPGSPWVCAGCVLCLADAAEVRQIDGAAGFVRKNAMRSFSWVVTADRAVAATKKHLDQLRALCLDPPEPPYALVLSDSGQTHQLYRAAVGRDRAVATANLEGEPIAYRPADLAVRLTLAGKLVAATGKPALAGPIDPGFARLALDYHADGEPLLEAWGRLREQPLSRLARFLCPNKEASRLAYPSTNGPGDSAAG